MKRRTLLLSAGAATGGLLLGVVALPPRARLGGPDTWPALAGNVPLNGWIQVRPDGAVQLAMPRCEMGQGVHTALSMLVAEELDLPLDRIVPAPAGHHRIYGNVAMFVGSLPLHPRDLDAEPMPVGVRLAQWTVRKLASELGVNATGGSSSVADAWETMRMAAAVVRASLLTVAAQRWGVPVQTLGVQHGVVVHASGRQAHFGELAAAAAGVPPGGQVAFKNPNDWRLIGSAVPRTDVPDKVTGVARFGVDVRIAGLRYAALQLCPRRGGAVHQVDTAPALARPGVRQVVVVPPLSGGTGGVAVVADSWWQASQAARALSVAWTAPDSEALPDSQAIVRALRQDCAEDAGYAFHRRGERPGPPPTLQANYSAPYLAHATLEPMNCTALVAAGKVTVWAPTQVPGLVQAAAAKVAGVAVDDVRVESTLLGGGFGRRLEVDVAAQAVYIAQAAAGQPVQLIWTREQDFQHDFYRPAQAALLQAWVDKGQMIGLQSQSVGDAVAPRWMERVLPALAGPVDVPDRSTAEGLFDGPYAVPYQLMRHSARRSGVPVGFWRSVGHSHNAFFMESFIDELALQAGQDPVTWRRQLLRDAPRHLAVLDLCARQARWGEALPPGRALGMALHESFGSVVALVLEVSLEQGRPRVHKAVCAIDCGVVVHPGVVAQQMEGAVVFGLSAALHGQVLLQAGEVRIHNFPDQPLLGMVDAPPVATHMVPSTRAPSGVGEPGVPPVAPALANALARLTGRRQRDLPLRGPWA